MAKVGKAFGFSVPPRVNVNIGGGQSTSSSTPAGKRKRVVRDEDEEDVQIDAVDTAERGAVASDDEMVDEERQPRNQGRKRGEERRRETLGAKSVKNEVFRKGKEREKMKKMAQWSK